MVEGAIMGKFDDFWAIYPRKKEKKRARVSFNRLPKKTQIECIEGVRKYIKQIQIQGNARLGFCTSCGDCNTYDKFQIHMENSRCCGVDLKPTRS
mgnify:CR=1 FL=1